jgi:molecular chaperone GrpE
MKNWFKKKNMENKDVLENEDLIQEELAGQVEETPEKKADTKQINPIEKENEALKMQVEELKDKYLRQAAEFENFRRRSVKEKLENIQTAARDTLAALLPILDDFDRASKNEQFTEGVNLVHQKLINTVTAKGLKAMDSPAGADFDPEFHEAITEIPAPNEALQGKIIDTVEKGYFLNDKIIRHAKVVVGK